MAASSDKVRFYLEQLIPELQELQRKKIFSKVGLQNIDDIWSAINNPERKKSLR